MWDMFTHTWAVLSPQQQRASSTKPLSLGWQAGFETKVFYLLSWIFPCCFSKYRLVFLWLRVNDWRYRFLIFPFSCSKQHFKYRRKETAGWTHFLCVTECVKVSVYMRQLTSLRSLVVKQVTFYKRISFFQKWLRHFRAKISLFDNGAGTYLFRESIQLCCIWCWPPDMYTAQHKSSSCTSENATQSTQCSGNRILCRASPGWVSTNLQRTDRLGRACQCERANNQEPLALWQTNWVLRLSKLWEVRCSHFTRRRGCRFLSGSKLMGIAPRQELSIPMYWPNLCWADVMIRQTTTAELRWPWHDSCCVLHQLDTGCMSRSIKILFTALRLLEQWPGPSVW